MTSRAAKMVACFLAIVSGVAAILSAPLAHRDAVEVARRWKLTGGKLDLGEAYVRSMARLHRRGRRCYLIQHGGQMHAAIVDQRRRRVHVVEAFLWSHHSSDDARVAAMEHFAGEYRRDRRRTLVAHLPKADTDLWRESLRRSARRPQLSSRNA